MGEGEDKAKERRAKKARKDALGTTLDAHKEKTGKDPLRELVQKEQDKPMEDMAREYRDLVQECVESGDSTPEDHKRMDGAAAPVKVNKWKAKFEKYKVYIIAVVVLMGVILGLLTH